jgi:hypothetical protein
MLLGGTRPELMSMNKRAPPCDFSSGLIQVDVALPNLRPSVWPARTTDLGFPAIEPSPAQVMVQRRWRAPLFDQPSCPYKWAVP